MNKENAKDFLPLVQALAEGKTIQYNDGGPFSIVWVDRKDLAFDCPVSDCRIKPKPREFWVNRSPNGRCSALYLDRRAAERSATCGDVQVCFREVIE